MKTKSTFKLLKRSSILFFCLLFFGSSFLSKQALGIDLSFFGRRIIFRPSSAKKILKQDNSAQTLVDNPSAKSFDESKKLKKDLASASFIVAASDSQNKERADYVADGIDDQVEIKAAIDALPDAGGRVVLLEGTYYINDQILISDLDNNNYVALEGQGWGTIFKVPDGHSSTMRIINVDGAASPLTGIKIKNLRIDGNRANVTGTFYIGVGLSNVVDSVIEGVYLANGRGSGGDGYGYWLNKTTDITIKDCVGKDWDYEPMEIRDSSRILITGCKLEYRIELYDDVHYVTFNNNTFVNNAIVLGTDTGTDSLCKQIKINNNYFYTDVDRTAGTGLISVRRGTETQIVGNQFYINGANNHGVWVSDDGGRYLIANNFFHLGTGTSNGVNGTAKNSSIIGNYFYHNHQNVGISLIRSTFNNISGNYSYNVKPSSYGSRLVSLYADSNFNVVKNNFCYNIGDTCLKVESNNNEIFANRVFGNSHRGIYLLGDNNRVIENNIEGSFTYAPIVDEGSGNVFRRNVGYTTENSGTATIVSGTTYVDVAHGLSVSPSASQINIVPSNDLGNANKYWISDVGSSTFRINVDTDPGVAAASFNWNIAAY